MSPLSVPKLTFRLILIYGFIALCCAAFVMYVMFQARFLIAGPQITVENVPKEQMERQITLQGQAKNIVNITLNGRPIYTDKDGNFKEALVLENGYTIATLQAEDRYGRSTNHTETFVYTEEDVPQEVVIN